MTATDKDEIFAFNYFLDKHMNKSNTINSVYHVIINQSAIFSGLRKSNFKDH